MDSIAVICCFLNSYVLTLFVCVCVSPPCYVVFRKSQGIGTNEKLVHTIICGRTNKDMEIIKKTFFKCYTEDLGQYMASELGGNMEALIINCLQAAEEEYDPEYHNEEKMAEDIKKLYEMGQGKVSRYFRQQLCAPSTARQLILLLFSREVWDR